MRKDRVRRLTAATCVLAVVLVFGVSAVGERAPKVDGSAETTSASCFVTPLPPPINTPYHEAGGSLSPDGNMMVFASDRPGGMAAGMAAAAQDAQWAAFDLWMSERVGDDWSEPVNLGPTVNTEWEERNAQISHDGTMLYFRSNRPGGPGGFDMYQIQ